MRLVEVISGISTILPRDVVVVEMLLLLLLVVIVFDVVVVAVSEDGLSLTIILTVFTVEVSDFDSEVSMMLGLGFVSSGDVFLSLGLLK